MRFDPSKTTLTEFIIFLLVGIATFMIGMSMMSSSLKKVSGKGVKKLFKKTESNVFANVGIGAATTALVQSSAATSVMAIGFISAGVMSVYQGAATVMGAYLGTTITGVLASFSGFSLSTYLLLLSVVGVILTFFKNELVKNIGGICAGLGLLFFGLGVMSGVFKSSTDISQYVQNFCTKLETMGAGPLLLWLLGVVLTVIFQSSSATSGIVIVMVGSGSLTFESGIFLVLGATVGTVITTVLAAIGGNTNVKRLTVFAILNRLICSLIALFIIWPLASNFANFFKTAFGSVSFGLAMFLVIYNLFFLVIWIPLLKPATALVTKMVKDKTSEKKNVLKYIDKHLVDTPSIAIMQTKREIREMLTNAKLNFAIGFDQIINQNMKNKDELIEREDNIDYVNAAISEYLIAVSNKATAADERVIGSYFHMINDIERIGDHAYNFYEQAQKMLEADLHFSDTAKAEFQRMYNVIMQMFNLADKMFERRSKEVLKQLHNLEGKTDDLQIELSAAHFERMTKKTCHVELSPYYSTLVSELERVADHIVNVGYLFVNPTGEDTDDNTIKHNSI